MASIQTAIQITDRVSGPILRILSSVNQTVAAFEEMQQATQAPVHMAWVESVRQDLNDASADVIRLQEAMEQAGSVKTSPVIEPEIRMPDMPAVWETDPIEVFTGTGMSRFRQEIDSANQMMAQLNRGQEAVAQQARNTSLFPPEMTQDLNRLAVRIDAVRSRIQAIENNPVNLGTDTANAELERLRGQLAQAVQEQQELNTAMGQMDVSAANAAYLRLSGTIADTEQYLRDNVSEQGNFNRAIQEGESHAGGLFQMIRNTVAAYAGM